MRYKFQKYLAYRWAARNEYSLHSPFMFDLYNAVFKKARKKDPAYNAIEQLRSRLLKEDTIIQVKDLGAGPKKNPSPQRKISEITRSASKKPRHARFIALLAHYLECRNIFELGTSMGISTAYLATKNPGSTVVTIEGSPQILAQAKENFKALQLHNIMPLEGAFDEVLPDLLEKAGGFDLLYVDGNHTYEATIRYFEMALKYAHNHSIVIFDDIYWSEGMTRAWEEIAAHEKVTASVDTFEFGVVFFKKELSKQHFILKL